MCDLILITGFLGAGKTTLLKGLIPMLAPQRLAVIINEFGREGVDGKLLSTLGVALAEINNGSLFCSCLLHQFQDTLAAIIEEDSGAPVDTVIVEASGLSDPSSIMKILAGDPRFSKIHYRGAICLVDATRFYKVYETAMAVGKQVDVGDLFLLNKADLATPDELARCRAILAHRRPGVPVYTTTMGKMEAAWIANLQPHGEGEGSLYQLKDISLQKYSLPLHENLRKEALLPVLARLSEGAYRVKGFVCLQEGTYLADCVGEQVHLTPLSPQGAASLDHSVRNTLVVLSGHGLPTGKLVKALKMEYPHVFA